MPPHTPCKLSRQSWICCSHMHTLRTVTRKPKLKPYPTPSGFCYSHISGTVTRKPASASLSATWYTASTRHDGKQLEIFYQQRELSVQSAGFGG
eukprot:799566-Pelagomonas_calceolata.AAC.2